MCCSELNWSVISDVATTVAALGALLVAIVGLDTWKQQLKGTSEYDLARKALLLTYQWLDEMRSARSPMLHLRAEEVEAGQRLREEQRIYEERLQRLQQSFAELNTVRLECKVVWGEAAYQAFAEIESSVRKYRGVVWLHFWLKGAFAGAGAVVDNSPDRVNQNNEDIYWIDDGGDFSKKILAGVNSVENYFSPRVRGF